MQRFDKKIQNEKDDGYFLHRDEWLEVLFFKETLKKDQTFEAKSLFETWALGLKTKVASFALFDFLSSLLH